MYEVVVHMSEIAMKVLNPPWKTAEPMSRRAFLDLPALKWKIRISGMKQGAAPIV